MVDRGKAGFKPATTVWQFTASSKRIGKVVISEPGLVAWETGYRLSPV